MSLLYRPSGLPLVAASCLALALSAAPPAFAQASPSTPPGLPPPYSPALEAETRSRHEAAARKAREPELSRAAAVERERERAWIQRGVIRETEPVPVRYPLVDTLVSGRLGGVAKGAEWFGAGVAARVFPYRGLAFELGGGVDAMGLEPSRRHHAFRIEPAVLGCLDVDGFGRGCLRGAIDVRVPVSGGSRSPDVWIALKGGLEGNFFVGALGNGGAAAVVARFDLVLGGGEGGTDPTLRRGGFGYEVVVGPSVAF